MANYTYDPSTDMYYITRPNDLITGMKEIKNLGIHSKTHPANITTDAELFKRREYSQYGYTYTFGIPNTLDDAELYYNLYVNNFESSSEAPAYISNIHSEYVVGIMYGGGVLRYNSEQYPNLKTIDSSQFRSIYCETIEHFIYNKYSNTSTIEIDDVKLYEFHKEVSDSPFSSQWNIGHIETLLATTNFTSKGVSDIFSNVDYYKLVLVSYHGSQYSYMPHAKEAKLIIGYKITSGIDYLNIQGDVNKLTLYTGHDYTVGLNCQVDEFYYLSNINCSDPDNIFSNTEDYTVDLNLHFSEMKKLAIESYTNKYVNIEKDYSGYKHIEEVNLFLKGELDSFNVNLSDVYIDNLHLSINKVKNYSDPGVIGRSHRTVVISDKIDNFYLESPLPEHAEYGGESFSTHWFFNRECIESYGYVYDYVTPLFKKLYVKDTASESFFYKNSQRILDWQTDVEKRYIGVPNPGDYLNYIDKGDKQCVRYDNLYYLLKYRNFNKFPNTLSITDISNTSCVSTVNSVLRECNNPAFNPTLTSLTLEEYNGCITSPNINGIFESCNIVKSASIVSPYVTSAVNAFKNSGLMSFSHNGYTDRTLHEIGNDPTIFAFASMPNLTDATSMFEGCFKLSYIFELQQWGPAVVNATAMFKGVGSNIDRIFIVTGGRVNGVSREILYTDNFILPTKINYASNMFEGSVFGNIAVKSPLTSCRQMFDGCGPLASVSFSSINTATDLEYMFRNCGSLTSVTLIRFPNATNARYMFQNCKKLGSINDADFTAIQEAEGMFYNCKVISNLNLTRKITLAPGSSQPVDVPGFPNRGIIKNAIRMFYGCSNVTDIPASSLGSLTDLTSTFEGCASLGSAPIGKVDFSSLVIANNTFKDCAKLTSIDSRQFANVTNADYMFANTGLTAILTETRGTDFNLPGTRDTDGFKKLVSAIGMFSGCKSLNKIYYWNFPLGRAVDFRYMFNGCTALGQNNFEVYSLKEEADVGTWLKTLEASYGGSTYGNINEVVYLFNGASRDIPRSSVRKWLQYKPRNSEDNLYEIHVTEMTQNDCNGNETPSANPDSLQYALYGNEDKLIDLRIDKDSFIDPTKYYNCTNMLRNCDNIVSVSSDLCFVKNCDYMFQDCDGLKRVIINNLNNMEKPTSSGKDAIGTFMGCKNLINVILSKTDEDDGFPHEVSFSGVTNAQDLFKGCVKLESIDNLNLMTNVIKAQNMFRGCTVFNLQEMSNFDSVENASGMFAGTAIERIDANAFGNLHKTDEMFKDCTNLTSAANLKLFSGYPTTDSDGNEVHRIDDSSDMFAGCNSLNKVDISYIDAETGEKIIPRIALAPRMFQGCTQLVEIDFSPFNNLVNGVNIDGTIGQGVYYMFDGCTALQTVDNFGISTDQLDDSYIFNGCNALRDVYFITNNNPQIRYVGKQDSPEWFMYDIKLGKSDKDGDYAEVDIYQADESDAKIVLKRVPSKIGDDGLPLYEQPYKVYYKNSRVLMMGGYVDELIFLPKNAEYSFDDLDTMMTKKVPMTDSGVTGREVLDPNDANMVLWAKNQSTFITNLVYPDGFDAVCDTIGSADVKEIILANWSGSTLPYRYELDVLFNHTNTYAEKNMKLRLLNNKEEELCTIPVYSAKGTVTNPVIREGETITFKVIKNIARMITEDAEGSDSSILPALGDDANKCIPDSEKSGTYSFNNIAQEGSNLPDCGIPSHYGILKSEVSETATHIRIYQSYVESDSSYGSEWKRTGYQDKSEGTWVWGEWEKVFSMKNSFDPEKGFALTGPSVKKEDGIISDAYIQISLPMEAWCSSMISMKIRVYEYDSNNSISEYLIKGYMYEPDHKWYSCTAVLLSSSNANIYESHIWFGAGSMSNPVILLSKTSGKSTYNYPQIDIYEISTGYSGKTKDVVKNMTVDVTSDADWMRGDADFGIPAALTTAYTDIPILPGLGVVLNNTSHNLYCSGRDIYIQLALGVSQIVNGGILFTFELPFMPTMTKVYRCMGGVDTTVTRSAIGLDFEVVTSSRSVTVRTYIEDDKTSIANGSVRSDIRGVYVSGSVLHIV